MDRLDFQLLAPGERLCEVELKAKHQRYNGWQDFTRNTPERDLFIVDELTIRKLLSAGRYAFLLLRDDPCDRWTVWSIMELVLASKTRATRQLATSNGGSKAKILLDLNDSSYHYTHVDDALTGIANLVATTDQLWNDIGAWPSGPPIATVGTKTPTSRVQDSSQQRKERHEPQLALEHR